MVRRLRLAAALSQEDLADKAQLHSTMVSRIERGVRTPSLVVLKKLADGFGITLTEMMSELERGTEEKAPRLARKKR